MAGPNRGEPGLVIESRPRPRPRAPFRLVDLDPFCDLADRDRVMNPLKDRLLGVKPPRFPTPESVLGGSIGGLRAMGFSTRKAEYIVASADAIATGAIDEAELPSLDRAAATEMLVGLRGIGRLSAEYVLLRGLGDIEVFPADDVGARNKLEVFFSLAAPPTREQILALMDPWRPYAGMIYFHLLLDGLAARGELDV